MSAALILKEVYQQDKLSIQHQFEPELVERNSMVELKPTLIRSNMQSSDIHKTR